MRFDLRTRAAEQMQAWALHNGIEYAGSVREAQAHVRCAEQGQMLDDLPGANVETDFEQWRPIIGRLQAAWVAALKLAQAAKAPDKPVQVMAAQPQQRSHPVVAPGTKSVRRPTPAASATPVS